MTRHTYTASLNRGGDTHLIAMIEIAVADLVAAEDRNAT